MLDALDKRIIAAMQDEFPLIERPYLEIAERLGISEQELLSRLTRYRQTGKIRKMGAVLRHREVGYQANALCAWILSPDKLDQAAKIAMALPSVTHCYARVSQPGWPYNFYVMLHAFTRKECRNKAADLAERIGGHYIMLFSTKEWKKTSMRYFGEGEAADD